MQQDYSPIDLDRYLTPFHSQLKAKGIHTFRSRFSKSEASRPKTKTTNTTMSQMNQINWLKKRHCDTTQAHYLKTGEEIMQEQEMQEIFAKIDTNNSGKVDVDELHFLFASNGVNISKPEITSLFATCKTHSKGYFTFEEFKGFYRNKEADQLFKSYIYRARRENTELYGPGVNQIFLPFNLTRLLEHLTLQQRREILVERIRQNGT